MNFEWAIALPKFERIPQRDLNGVLNFVSRRIEVCVSVLEVVRRLKKDSRKKFFEGVSENVRKYCLFLSWKIQATFYSRSWKAS